MPAEIVFENLEFKPKNQLPILSRFTAKVEKGEFVALLGENGAGKTTLLDLAMGFKKPTEGSLLVRGLVPYEDPWLARESISYLSEKMDIPGDWTVREYLDFNKFFYPKYSNELEKSLCTDFRVNDSARLGNMSAGELRRVQIVGALALQPEVIIVDEITAVLDIVGRRKFMQKLGEKQRQGCTILLATNILEDLENYVSHVMLIHGGSLRAHSSLKDFLGTRDKSHFSQLVADQLEAL